MANRIYILSGGSGAGKTVLLNAMLSNNPKSAVTPPKYSDRKKRNPNDDINTITLDDFNNGAYTFVYSMNNNIYGFKATEIIECLEKGKNVFVIVSDLRIIEEFKKYFGSLVLVIYIFRNMSEEELNEILEARESDNNRDILKDTESKIRKNRLYLIQRQYVENIALFDHVILNRTNKQEEMYKQLQNVVAAYSDPEKPIIPHSKGPVIFLIAAASGAGKRTLMHAMYTLGQRSIKVISKSTDRDAQDDDGREIIPNSTIDEEFDIHYEFNSNKYGIKSREIWSNLANGYPQIVITNMDEFKQFTEIFGNLAIGVYLHATRTENEIFELQKRKLNNEEKAKKKVEKMEEIHKGYIKDIAKFKHVLLNTIEKEDLWEQMFRLIKYYRE